MKRRDFCKFMAVSAAAVVGISKSGTAEAAGGSGFDQLNQTYPEFCATPANQRTFYALERNKIISEKLNNQHWRPTGWGNPPGLPVKGGSWDGVPMKAPVSGLAGEGPYKATWDSFMQYDCPEWYRDAKFAIWNHWSPQCVPEDGDWYARNMYIQGSGQNRYQCQHYGPPSRFGYKDLCAQWTLLNWEPGHLMDLYKKAGAKLFLAVANHHDGFDTWNSKHHQWNAANIGPHRDVIGTWTHEARQRGLRMGVTVHQARNWWWFQTAHGADTRGPLAGVPYDGALTKADGKGQWWDGYDPQQLYGAKHPHNALPDASYVKNFYDRTRDLIDQHNPDLLYFDNSLFPLGWGGMNIGAYFYNHNLKTHGKMEGIINVKGVPPHLAKSVVADIERGITSGIVPYPWQSETCIGNWHYQRDLFDRPGEYGGYLNPQQVIHWLCDAVSKNGTFVLNIPGKPDGTIDRKEKLILERLAEWFAVNGEAIYSTRPWKIFGQGATQAAKGWGNGFNTIKNLGANDIRFTRNKANTVIYAIFLGWPHSAFNVPAMGTASSTNPGKIAHVQMLGVDEPLVWKQTATGLSVQKPKTRPKAADYAVALKLVLA